MHFGEISQPCEGEIQGFAADRDIRLCSDFEKLWSKYRRHERLQRSLVREDGGTFQVISAGRKGGCYRKDALGGVWRLPLTDRVVGRLVSTTVDGPCLMLACVVQGLRVVELSRPRLVNFG